jgi:hypothetical protein
LDAISGAIAAIQQAPARRDSVARTLAETEAEIARVGAAWDQTWDSLLEANPQLRPSLAEQEAASLRDQAREIEAQADRVERDAFERRLEQMMLEQLEWMQTCTDNI